MLEPGANLPRMFDRKLSILCYYIIICAKKFLYYGVFNLLMIISLFLNCILLERGVTSKNKITNNRL